MRLLIIVLVTLGLAATAMPLAAAHATTCPWGDWSCWVNCQEHRAKYLLSSDHTCSWGPPLPP